MRLGLAPCVLIVAVSLPAGGHAETSQAKIWVGNAGDLESFLEKADVVSMQDLGVGANRPKRLTLTMGEETRRGLWKPIQRGPKEWAWESYETEVAAYRVDRMLGLDMVPPTVVKDIEGEVGSLQLWVEGGKLYEEVQGTASPPDAAAWEKHMSRMKVFDTLIGNWDRGPRNYMIDEGWDVVLIDHSQAFSTSTDLVKRLEELPARFDRQQIESVKGWDVEYLTFRFGRLLLRPQVHAMVSRRDALVAHVNALVEKHGEANVFFPEE